MSSSPDPSTDPRVHCPQCGKRFRVPASEARVGPEGAPARCSACGTTFRVRAVVFAPPLVETGERVGRYEVEEQLGRGGMGAVYRAFDPAANRHVALKVLAAGAPPEDRARFQREVEVQGNIQHPHIMPILDSGTIGQSRYFTMELLRDPLTLTELVELAHRGRSAANSELRNLATPEDLVRHVVLPICRAIHHANVKEGVLHRDLKPANVLVDRNGLRPFVIDFGVCSLLERMNTRLGHLPPEVPSRLANGGVRVTGTLLYMPPEQARGHVDRRGDVWALGAVLHHVFAGNPPLARATHSKLAPEERREGLELLIEQAERAGRNREAETFTKKLSDLDAGRERSFSDLQRDVLDARYQGLPAGTPNAVATIVRRAMEPNPDDRYRHALALHDDLVAWLDGRPVEAVSDRRGPLGQALYRGGLFIRRHRKATALLVVALGVGAWLAASLLGPRNGPPPEDTGPRCLAEAERALETGELDLARKAAASALSSPTCAEEAGVFLGTLDALGAARTTHLPKARGYAATVRDRRDLEGAHRAAGALGALLDSGLLDVLADHGTDAERAEVRALHTIRGERRTLAIAVPGGPVRVRAVVQSRRGSGGHFVWDAVQLLGQDGAPVVLGPGYWMLGFDRGAGEVWRPVFVHPGDDPLEVSCSVDPDRVPAGRCYVLHGTVTGPLGEARVEALVWDLTEVTGARYAAWLATLPPEERRRRVPRLPGRFGEADRPLWAFEGDEVVVPDGAADRPVEGISVYDARAFAKHEGGRLPTAAEWAWAAGGPMGRLTAVGDDLRRLVGNGVRIAAPERGAGDVASNYVDRSPFGIYDLAGNVSEMTSTLATFRGKNGWLVMGGGYATPLGRAIVTEAEPVPGWMPLKGVGFRLVYPPSE